MKKMKIFFISWLVTVSGFTIYSLYKSNQEEVLQKKQVILDLDKDKWTTFKKFGPGSTSHPSTEKELKQIKVGKKKKPNQVAKINRKPASLPSLDGRLLVGNNAGRYAQDETLVFLNEVNPEWENILGQELTRFQQPDTKVLVKKLDSMIQVDAGKGRYVEKVLITYLLANGAYNSFNALVDSSNGKVIQRWNRTIHEHFKRKNSRGLSPTGSL